MKKIKFILLSFVIGFITMIIIDVILVIGFLIIIKNIPWTPYTIQYVLPILHLISETISILISCILVGWLIKEKGWLYGFLFSFLYFLYFLLEGGIKNSYSYYTGHKTILLRISLLYLTTWISAGILGGLIGEIIRTGQRKYIPTETQQTNQ